MFRQLFIAMKSLYSALGCRFIVRVQHRSITWAHAIADVIES